MAEFPAYGNVLDESGSITHGSLACGTGALFLAVGAISNADAPNSVWQVANTAVFYPFAVESTVTAYQLSCINGTTVNGNVDMGIYDVNGNRLVSIGSTAQAGTTAVQMFDITNTVLTPAIYFLALASSSATATFACTLQAAAPMRVCGMQEMASAFPLPNPVTFATYARTQQPACAVHLVATA